MTRIVIFGDLHANWEALMALQQAEPHPDAVLCLGDIVGYGPDPKRCLDSVRATATHLIGGAHDRVVGTNSPFNGTQGLLRSTWAFSRAMLPDYDRDYLATLPTWSAVERAGAKFFLTRLAPDDQDTESQMLITMPQTALREQFSNIEADIIFVGGPHIPAMRQIGDKLIVCPGSLGLPYYGVPDPTFVAWEDGRLQIHHLHYHPQQTIRKLSMLPLGPEHVVRLQTILQTGRSE